MSDGFVRLIEQNLLKRNVTVQKEVHLELGLLEKSTTQKLEWGFSEAAPVDALILMVGLSDLTSDGGSSVQDMRTPIEELIIKAFTLHKNSAPKAALRIVVVTPLLFGEMLHGSNEYDSKIEEYVQLLKHLSLSYHVDFVDARHVICKFLESINSANQKSGLLTFDGKILNGMGNAVVAQLLLGSSFTVEQLDNETRARINGYVTDAEHEYAREISARLQLNQRLSVQVAS